jgi:protein ImuB
MRVLCILLEKKDDAQSIAEVFYRATPQIMLRRNQAIFLEISKCRHLYSESTFIKRAQVTLNRIGNRARLAVADDIPTALALAVFPAVVSKDDLPIESLKYFSDPLDYYPDQHTHLLKVIQTLKSLRVQTLKDFLRIPSYEISPRFGALILLAYQRIIGENPITWTEFKPLEIVQETFEFDLAYPPTHLEPVYFVFRPMLERVFLRLRGKGKRLRQFTITLRQEYPSKKSKQDYEVSVIIQLPFVSLPTIFQIAKEKMDASVQKSPLEHPIVSVTLVITEEAPYMTSQKDIFDQKKEETSESFYHLVSRLATKLGPEAVFFAQLKDNYLPERNWLRASEKPDNQVQEKSVPQRPLRLFKEPLSARIYENQLLFNHHHYDIKSWENPEVLLSNWWEISDNERIYYNLHTQTGERFWIYKTREALFVHGVFE